MGSILVILRCSYKVHTIIYSKNAIRIIIIIIIIIINRIQ